MEKLDYKVEHYLFTRWLQEVHPALYFTCSAHFLEAHSHDPVADLANRIDPADRLALKTAIEEFYTVSAA